MENLTVDQLGARLEAIHRQYAAHFAGQPRITRDPSLLEAIVEEIDETMDAAKSLNSKEASLLLDKLKENRKLYIQEAEQIRQIRNDPNAQQHYELVTWISVVAGRYQRFFAKKSRKTRDVGLLHEISEDAERLYLRVESLGNDANKEMLDSLGNRKKLYANEIEAISQARTQDEPEAIASTLAARANDQFRLYEKFFSGENRVSRRPARMMRMVDNLETILDEMRGLQETAFQNEHNDRNIEIVLERLTFFQKELQEIQVAKSGAQVSELGTALADAANRLLERYQQNFAGKDRRSCELDTLADIIEGLYDIARQMEDLQLMANIAENHKNLRVVLESLALYEREYSLIEQAKQN